MNRYCTNCQKEFDFKITSMEDLDNLICPECGAKIDKNSHKPVSTGPNTAEKTVSNAISGYYTIRYYIHFVLALIGLIAYFNEADKLLYIMTASCVILFLLQLFFRRTGFISGIILVPAGALIGFFLMGKVLRGACLGIVVVFIIRHLIRGFNYYILSKLVHMGNQKR